MWYGAQYYPEHWPEETWAEDARLMQEAGFNTVRMGEFAWSAYEPAEGKLDFSWMDRAVALLGEHGIQTLMCTCSRTPPVHILKDPRIPCVDPSGHPVAIDVRYVPGLDHPEFRVHADRIDRMIIERYADNPNVIGFQIDNEIGSHNDCHCDGCVERFRSYLKEIHGDVESLREAWGDHVWGFSPWEFDDIPAARNNPALKMAYRRFISSRNIAFTKQRVDWIREAAPEKLVTTNFQSIGAVHTDAEELSKILDVPGMNYYPLRTPPFGPDFYRLGGDQMFVLEQFTRLGEVDEDPAMMRWHAWQAVSRGVTGVWFFRWRQPRWGREQFGDGLMPSGGGIPRRYKAAAQMGKELQPLHDRLARATTPSDIAIVGNYTSRWAFHSHTYGLPNAVNPLSYAKQVSAVLDKSNRNHDATTPAKDLSRYKLLIAPGLFCLNDVEATALTNYVKNGGTLVLIAPLPTVDQHGKTFDIPRPGALAPVSGVNALDMLPISEPTAVASDVINGLESGYAVSVADDLEMNGAEVLARFASGWRANDPLVTRRSHGRGQVFTVAAQLDPSALEVLLNYLLDVLEIPPICETPAGVEVRERMDTEGLIWFLLNKTDAPLDVPMACSWKDGWLPESGTQSGPVTVPPHDLRVILPS